jgi:hypothetical protein
MADNGGGGNTGVVAVLVIFLIVVAALFIAWRAGLFGGRRTSVNVNITVPQSSSSPQQPSQPKSSP